MVAPVTGNDLGMRRAEIKPGLREIYLCKDERGKTGVKLRNIDKVIWMLSCLGALRSSWGDLRGDHLLGHKMAVSL